MGDHGKITSTEKYRHNIGVAVCMNSGKAEEFAVSEFKIGAGPGLRMMAVLEGSVYVLTHGCPKPKDSQLPVEVERASRIFCEDRSRRRLSISKEP